MSLPKHAEDTFIAPGAGSLIQMPGNPLQHFALQVWSDGASSWTVVLEGSLNGVDFDTILTHNTATGEGKVIWPSAYAFPSFYFRARCTALTLGGATYLKSKWLGMP